MKEHQILYSKEMILAKLAGRKTVTRRPVKQDVKTDPNGELLFSWREQPWLHSPYSGVGDRLWTKENFSIAGCSPSTQSLLIEYRADENFRWVQLTDQEWEKYGKWKQPNGPKSKLFMFRSLSRFLDEITEITIERVQDITEEEAKNEGVDPLDCKIIDDEWNQGYSSWKEAFKILWQSMYEGGEFDWHNNPWVWVIRYTSLAGNMSENQHLEFRK